eukprot:TRINITY_DN26928_c0_g1_i1.p1 TRINITY_DN26928_c0_g1~~TRINITY_DN26928_c0_g1_i1.p1  ORF type:complete len:120 (+),score=28.71 TRINITY_DN26928_c0_g1_i1:56-361(+)
MSFRISPYLRRLDHESKDAVKAVLSELQQTGVESVPSTAEDERTAVLHKLGIESVLSVERMLQNISKGDEEGVCGRPLMRHLMTSPRSGEFFMIQSLLGIT